MGSSWAPTAFWRTVHTAWSVQTLLSAVTSAPAASALVMQPPAPSSSASSSATASVRSYFPRISSLFPVQSRFLPEGLRLLGTAAGAAVANEPNPPFGLNATIGILAPKRLLMLLLLAGLELLLLRGFDGTPAAKLGADELDAGELAATAPRFTGAIEAPGASAPKLAAMGGEPELTATASTVSAPLDPLAPPLIALTLALVLAAEFIAPGEAGRESTAAEEADASECEVIAAADGGRE